MGRRNLNAQSTSGYAAADAGGTGRARIRSNNRRPRALLATDGAARTTRGAESARLSYSDRPPRRHGRRQRDGHAAPTPRARPPGAQAARPRRRASPHGAPQPVPSPEAPAPLHLALDGPSVGHPLPAGADKPGRRDCATSARTHAASCRHLRYSRRRRHAEGREMRPQGRVRSPQRDPSKRRASTVRLAIPHARGRPERRGNLKARLAEVRSSSRA